MDWKRFNYFKKFYNKKRLKFEDQESNDMNSYYLMHKSKKLKVSLRNDSSNENARQKKIDDSIESKTTTTPNTTHDLSSYSNQLDDTCSLSSMINIHDNKENDSNSQFDSHQSTDQPQQKLQQQNNRTRLQVSKNLVRGSKSALVFANPINSKSTIKSNSESAIFKYKIDSITNDFKSFTFLEESSKRSQPKHQNN